MTVTYRAANTEDAPALADFAARAFRRSHHDDASAQDIDDYVERNFGVEQQTAELTDPSTTFFLAHSDSELIGYVQLRLDRYPHCALEPAPVRCAEAKRVYVDAAWHGRGIAAELMRQCCDAARAAACDWIWLAVWKQNGRALEFYRKCGFGIGGEQTFQLGSDRQDDWVMTKPLLEAGALE